MDSRFLTESGPLLQNRGNGIGKTKIGRAKGYLVKEGSGQEGQTKGAAAKGVEGEAM